MAQPFTFMRALSSLEVRALFYIKTKFVCVDGPEFDGHLVDFDNMINRHNAYKKQEGHSCKIGRKGDES